ncbi:MAG TPA: PSD1 and planctomycete cytochrome C domain-containing protein [Verrucomicrobiae bacterium]|nr:PSD1 and planctomycete cytochrome C domain-containing protein [Verrucomicrobiae bacterium]
MKEAQLQPGAGDLANASSSVEIQAGICAPGRMVRTSDLAVPEGHPTIAQRFGVGERTLQPFSPEGTAEPAHLRPLFSRPFGTHAPTPIPNAEASGYSQSSLRDENKILVASAAAPAGSVRVSPVGGGMHRLGSASVGALFVLFLGGHCRAVEPTPAQLEFFENRVRPVLSENCYRCHSQHAEKIKAGLLLDSRQGVLKGGEGGPAIMPGDPEHSLLIKAIRYTDPDLQMPPKGKKLSDAAIADLTAWVQMGAPDPRGDTGNRPVETSKSHWAWQPLTHPAVPEVKDSSWPKTPIDNFILAKLEEKGLKPNPPADKRTLLRRATFDLIGLPPTPQEIDDFLKDDSPDAFAKVVDRLLASPHYGERWGRHWLDVARYSDTKGQVRRQREDPNYPFAWTYRDYVIRSFNQDKPYNLFVIEQIAADKLPATARNPTNLCALGFLTVGDRFMGMQNDIINDRIDVVTKGFLGLTVTCARCHDHKFDPIPTRDYYSLYGVFANCAEPSIEPVIQEHVGGPEYHDYYEQRMAIEREKEAIQARFREYRRARNREGLRQLQRAQRENATKIARLEMTHPGAPARAMVLEDLARTHDTPVFIRGDAGNKGPLAPRHFLEVLAGSMRPAFTNGSGRLDLAWAIVSKGDPITPRVMINRIWLHHFGEGFVSTPDDFGMMSEPPSHPELLDYLASRFLDEGWSIKKIHRLILLSSVYQESSANNPRYAQVDPDNRLLWRANIRRLEFEALRDSLLAIGGDLDLTMYGRPVEIGKEPYSRRRTIYGRVDRANVADVLINFDFADPSMPNGRRHQTTVPQQALFLMNSPLVVEQAKHLVALRDFRECDDDAARIQFLYERIYQRPPSPEETKLGIEFIEDKPASDKVAAGPRAVRPVANFTGANQFRPRRARLPQTRNPLTVWQEYAHALLQANEVSFLN